MPRKLINKNTISREEWLQLRKSYIGGSDAATIIGLNPYGSLLELYADKKGLLPEKEDTEAMRQGRDFEDYVASRWEEATGKKCRKSNFVYLHDKYDFIGADIDRDVVGENAGLECKTTSVYNKSDIENDEIPLNYYVQCIHYMAVMGYDRMYLAVLVLNRGFYTFVIERNEEEINNLIAAEIDFWNKYIMANKMPEADGSESAQRALNAIYPADKAKDSQVLLMQYEDRLERYEALQEQIKALEKEADAEKQAIIAALGDSSYGVSQKYKVSYSPQTRTSIDTKLLKTEMPEIYEKYSKQSVTRAFRVTKMKEVI